MKEIWKDIKDYEGLYQVSNFGNVKSLTRNGTKGGLIKLVNRHGYLRARLWKNKVLQTIGVHRLVAQAFTPNIYDKEQVNHIDGNKLNNNANNLEWVSHSENMEHAYNNGLVKTKKVAQIKDGKVIKIYLNIYRASLDTKIQYSSIYWCANGIYKHAGGYEWKYI